jgi:anti-sigma factor RsiW
MTSTTSGIIQPDQQNPSNCAKRSVEIAAYLDGELDSQTATLFEQHTRECSLCAAGLNEQKRLLCLLDIAFFCGPTLETQLDLPQNFARVVTARAQTDMSGMRHSATEQRRAFLWSALLAAASFCLLGVTMFGAALSPFTGAARAFVSVLGMICHVVRDAGAGAGVVLRAVVGRFIVADFYPHKILTWLLLATVVLLLYKLIGNYHHTRSHE